MEARLTLRREVNAIGCYNDKRMSFTEIRRQEASIESLQKQVVEAQAAKEQLENLVSEKSLQQSP